MILSVSRVLIYPHAENTEYEFCCAKASNLNIFKTANTEQSEITKT